MSPYSSGIYVQKLGFLKALTAGFLKNLRVLYESKPKSVDLGFKFQFSKTSFFFVFLFAFGDESPSGAIVFGFLFVG